MSAVSAQCQYVVRRSRAALMPCSQARLRSPAVFVPLCRCVRRLVAARAIVGPVQVGAGCSVVLQCSATSPCGGP